MKLLKIILKNFKLIARSRISAMITIFGPLLITLLVGLAFNNASSYNIKIGIYSPDYSDFVNGFITKIDEAHFRTSQLESAKECKDQVRQGTINLCMVFPEEFELATKEDPDVNNNISFYVDPSRINIVYSVIDTISARVASRSEEISSELTNQILETLSESRQTISDQETRFNQYVETNEDMKSKTSSVQNKLASMDFTFSKSDFQTNDLLNLNTTISSDLLAENATINTVLNESQELLLDIIDDVSDNETIGDLEELQEDLEDLDDEVDDLRTGDLSRLSSMIEGIENQIDEVQTKMDSARTSKNQISSDLNTIKSSLDTNLNRIMSVKTDLDKIKTKIDSIQVTEAATIVSPIETKIEPVVSETYLSYMFPGLVALVIMLVALLFSSTLIMMEKNSKAYFRNLVIPIPDWLYIVGALITTLLLLVMQLALILGVSAFAFDVNVGVNILPNILMLFLISLFFTVVGILIGVAFTSPETATLAAISVGSISLFLSDIILPLESMPTYLIDIARFNPFVISEFLLRRSILFSASLPELFREAYSTTTMSAFVVLLLYIVVFSAMLFVLNVIIRKHLLGRYMRKLGPHHPPEEEIDTSNPQRRIELLNEEALRMIKLEEFDKARDNYHKINELYARLPKDVKKKYFKKIVDLKEKINSK